MSCLLTFKFINMRLMYFYIISDEISKDYADSVPQENAPVDAELLQQDGEK